MRSAISHILTNLYVIGMFCTLTLGNNCAQAQYSFERKNIAVTVNQALLKNPWAGGINSAQLLAIDLNLDGIQDLFVFDRTGDKILTYINNGTTDKIDYTYAPQYQSKFPKLTSWVYLADYNCDGKTDIFAHYNGGIEVYKNTSSPTEGLKFLKVSNQLFSNYLPANYVPLYVSNVDYPAIADIDNDGDLDIVTFNDDETHVGYHKNYSKELYASCDSLVFKQESNCFGHFSESFSNCEVFLNTCTKDTLRNTTSNNKLNRHAGSSLLCIDMDGDMDKELLLGDISCNSLTQLINGGTTKIAHFSSKEGVFPAAKPVDLIVYPFPFYIDVNNDNKRDLIVTCGTDKTSENSKSIWYYKNTGTDSNPLFSYVQNDLLQADMIDVGEGAYPAFFDFNADGLTDLLISNTYYLLPPTPGTYITKVAAYKNTGTNTQPTFEFVTDDYANLGAQILDKHGFILTFGDLDADGDKDMVVGDEEGYIYRFNNTAAIGTPATFVLTPGQVKDELNNEIDVGDIAAPQLTDVNHDNLLDLIIGNRRGKLKYYQNVGTAANPSFKKITDDFGKVDVGRNSFLGYSTPTLFVDSNKTHLFVGSYQGYCYHYTNIDNNLTGAFTLKDSLFSKPTETAAGSRIASTIADITADGLLDMVVGNYSGGATYYAGTKSSAIHELAMQARIETYPNPTKDELRLKITNIVPRDMQLHVFNLLGQEVLYYPLKNEVLQTVSTATLSNGVYFITIAINKQQQVTQRIVISR